MPMEFDYLVSVINGGTTYYPIRRSSTILRSTSTAQCP